MSILQSSEDKILRSVVVCMCVRTSVCACVCMCMCVCVCNATHHCMYMLLHLVLSSFDRVWDLRTNSLAQQFPTKTNVQVHITNNTHM